MSRIICLIIACLSTLNLLCAETLFVDEAQIYYHTLGQGQPLLIVHDGPGQNSSYFSSIVKPLSEQYQVILYDQRGSGQSFKNLDFDAISISQFVQDLEQLRRHLGHEKVLLLGHGFGALVTILYSAEYPEHVEKLVLLNPMPSSSQDLSSFIQEIEARLKKSQNPAVEFLNSDDFLTADASSFKSFYDHLLEEFVYDTQSIKRLNFQVGQQDALQGFIIYRLFEKDLFENGYDYKAKLKHFKMPVLMIHGDRDPIPLWTAQATNSLIRQSELKVFEKCGHYPHVEKPEEFLEALSVFLNRKP